MLEYAAAVGTSRPVEWRQADAMKLPFSDQAFDVVVCQFGVMFIPDKQKVPSSLTYGIVLKRAYCGSRTIAAVI
ncbi:MAG: methyltransferase domain-containing protein [Gallionella sp.]|jgi:ubiquinone/menaquinone biosynthesis C-methylase UbiE